MSDLEQRKRRCKSTTTYVALILPLVLFVSACGLVGSYAGLTQQARSIRTPADHRAVAQAYRERAQRLRADAAEHAALATGAEGSERTEQCRRLAEDLGAAAAEADVMAEKHERLTREFYWSDADVGWVGAAQP